MKSNQSNIWENYESNQVDENLMIVSVSPNNGNEQKNILENISNYQKIVKAKWKGLLLNNNEIPALGKLFGKQKITSKPSDHSNQIIYSEAFMRKIESIIFDSEINQGQSSVLPLPHSYILKFHPISEAEYKNLSENSISNQKKQIESSILFYKIFKSDARIVKLVLENNGMIPTDGHFWNVYWTNSYTKTYMYEGLNEYQKINHFPYISELTRKDRLSDNIENMKMKFSDEEFSFLPETFILPDDYDDFEQAFERQYLEGSPAQFWIVKPCALSRGRGIFIIDDISDVPEDENCVISKYISNPLLINGLKFDLRIYVLISCLEPLRIYIYDEGMARFASEKYRLTDATEDVFAHLTNYSINKKNKKYIQNKSISEDDYGHKWSLSALFSLLRKIGIDTTLLWSRIYDIIIKSILSVYSQLVKSSKDYVKYRTNCFEYLGYDILVDSELKPWLLEVNLTPSLACESPLDTNLKSNIMADMFSLIGIRPFERRKDFFFKNKNKFFSQLNKSKKDASQDASKEGIDNIDYYNNMIKDLTKKQKEMILETLQEEQRRNHFIRIYPSKGSDYYNRYLEVNLSINKFIYKFLYEFENQEISPLNLPSFNTPSKIEIYNKDKDKDIQRISENSDINNNKNWILEELLIEYLSRLSQIVESSLNENLNESVSALDKFLRSNFWKYKINKEMNIIVMIRQRINELRENIIIEQGDPKSKIQKEKEKVKTKVKEKEKEKNSLSGISFYQLKDLLSEYKESNNLIMNLSNLNFFKSLFDHSIQKSHCNEKLNEKEPKMPKISQLFEGDFANEIEDNSESKISIPSKTSKREISQVNLPSSSIKIIYPDSINSEKVISKTSK